MEIKILQVFYGKDGLPYKDKDRQVHFPIVGAAIQGASNTTKIRFYFDELVNEDEETTSWVVVSKLPNGKIGSEIVETELDSELNEHYALFSLKNFYTQAKGDLFLSLQGYQGGVKVETDPDTGISQIIGTPTIQATGSIKLAINYSTQLIGSGETANINFQKILADLGTKLGIRAYTERVTELPTTGQTNVFYAIYDDPSNPNKLNIYVWNGTTQSYVWVGDNTLYLGDYYTKEQGDQFEENIGEQVGNLNNRVESVENELESVASGSPSGAYANLAAVAAAFPTGNSNIYITLDNGHWCYWNGSAWTDGGVYLSTGNAVPDTRTIAGIDLADDITKDELKNALDIFDLEKSLSQGMDYFEPEYEDGDINSQGQEISSTNWIRSGFIPVNKLVNAEINIEFAHSYLYANFVFYNQSQTFISYSHKNASFVFDTYPQGTYYVRIVLPKAESSKNYFSMYVIANWVNKTVTYNDKITLKLGNELITENGHYDDGSGWSGDNSIGYTHTAGGNGVLSFYGIGVEQNSQYLLEFDTNYDSDEFLTVGIGAQYKVLVYNGDTHIIVPLKSDTGTTLYFQPIANVGFTISNISLKKIDANGTNSKTINVYRTMTPNHILNKGFWNVLIGEYNMENSIGSTRCLAIGYASMRALQGGHRNIGLGTFTMSQMVGGENNIAIGADSMLALVEGSDNISIGKGAMYNGRNKSNNVAIGAYALTGAVSTYGSNNVSIGKNSGYKSKQSDNVFVGFQAGYNVETGTANVIIGSNAYANADGDYNIAIGRNAGYANDKDNTIAIGYGAYASKSNQVVIGNSNTEEIVLGNKKLTFNLDGTVTWENV